MQKVYITICVLKGHSQLEKKQQIVFTVVKSLHRKKLGGGNMQFGLPAAPAGQISAEKFCHAESL